MTVWKSHFTSPVSLSIPLCFSPEALDWVLVGFVVAVSFDVDCNFGCRT